MAKTDNFDFWPRKSHREDLSFLAMRQRLSKTLTERRTDPSKMSRAELTSALVARLRKTMDLQQKRQIEVSEQAKIRFFVHGGAATPLPLLKVFVEAVFEAFPNADQRPQFLAYHLHTEGELPYLGQELQSHFKVQSLFCGSNVRSHFDQDSVDYIPCFLSEMGALFESGLIPLDFALIQLSTEDRQGFYSLGPSVDIAKAAVRVATEVVAMINPQMPRTHGDGFIHRSECSFLWECSTELFACQPKDLTQSEKKIGQLIAELVEDGSTLQAGIGAVPDAALAALAHHRHLGLHSEMWSDQALRLIESGVIDNSRKVVHPGKSVATFVIGSRRLYQHLDDNPSCVLLEASYVNQPNIIARNPKMVAINSCIQMDLSGQVCADSVGHRIISGVGGQMDFLRAAYLSKGGKPIMAMTSRSKKGKPKIVAQLDAGAGVVTTRSHIHWVVTEFGRVNLHGLSLSQRARALIQISHPEDREGLERDYHEILRKISCQ